MKTFIEPKKLVAVITPLMASVILSAVSHPSGIYKAYYDEVTTVTPDDLSANLCFEQLDEYNCEHPLLSLTVDDRLDRGFFVRACQYGDSLP